MATNATIEKVVRKVLDDELSEIRAGIELASELPMTADPRTVTPEELGVAMTGAILSAGATDDPDEESVADHVSHAHRYSEARGGNQPG